MKKIYLLLLFLGGMMGVFGQRYIVDTEGIGKYGYLDKNATTYIRMNSGTESNIYELFARTWTGTSQLTYGTAVNVCGTTSNVYQSTSNYTFASGMSPGSIAYTSVHANYCGGTNSYSGNPNNTGINEKQHYIFEFTTRNSDLSSSIVVGSKNVVMSAKIDFGSLNDRKLQRFWIKNNGTFAEGTGIENGGFKIYYEAANGSETFDGSESNAMIYGNYAGNATNNNEYGHDALNIDIPAGGLRIYVVLENFNCTLDKNVSVSLLNDGLSFIPLSSGKNLARVNSLPLSSTTIGFSRPTTPISQTTQTKNIYQATDVISVPDIAGANYQWYRQTTNQNYGGTLIAGATSRTFTPSSLNIGTSYYYSIVTTGAGACDLLVSGTSEVIINASGAPNWANIQSPKIAQTDLYEGQGIPEIYAQVYIPGVTPGANVDGVANPTIIAQIGYSSTNNDPFSGGWTWLTATYNPAQSARVDYNDEYSIYNFGKELEQGTYYIASRFSVDGGANFVYGGIDSTPNTTNDSGGPWNGTTYVNLPMTINKTITWNGSSWNNTVGPSNYFPWASSVIADATNAPPSFSTKNLTINNGVTFTIPSGNTVTVQNQIINLNGNDSPDTFVVKSDGNLIQINPVTNTSEIKVERSVTALNNIVGTNIDYVYWSSPVANQNLQLFSPGTARNRIYEYRESNDYFYQAPESDFIAGKGYAIRAETTGVSTPSYDKMYEFSGIPHNGDVDYEIKRSANTGTSATVVHGYNLVGNPYPSNIDFDVLYQNNSNKIYNTAWFWQTNTILLNQTGNGYVGNNYVIYNGTGGNNSTNNNGSAINAPPNGIIKVGQGFIVQNKGSEGSTTQLNFKNSYGAGQDLRVADVGTFYQKNINKPVKNRFWLKLISPENISNTQLIGYVNGATDGYEKDFDAVAFSLSSDLFYSVLEDKKLVIQGKANQFSQQDKIALGANFFQNGNYTIALENPEGIFGKGQNIYLKDSQTGIITNLSEGPYTFTVNAGQTNNRFEIIYQPESVLATDGIDKEQILVYYENNDFVIKSPKEIRNVELYDSSGKLVFTMKGNSKELRFSSEKLINGMYILKTELKTGEQLTKKIKK